MAVYIDDYRARYGRLVMSHMIADTDAELHQMADALGLKRRWFQDDHYDVCWTKRKRAISLGAIEITVKQCAAMNRRRKVTGSCGDPADAWLWLRGHRISRLAASRQAEFEDVPVSVDYDNDCAP